MTRSIIAGICILAAWVGALRAPAHASGKNLAVRADIMIGAALTGAGMTLQSSRR